VHQFEIKVLNIIDARCDHEDYFLPCLQLLLVRTHLYC